MPEEVAARKLSHISKRNETPPLMNPLLIQKWEHAFHVFFDFNKDGTLEWDDFELLIHKIKEARGEDSADYEAAVETMQSIWHELSGQADLDSDNKVSQDEWRHMWFVSIGEPKGQGGDSWQDLYLDYMFKLLDSTGDELIDISEYIEVMAFYGIGRDEAEWAFDKFALGSSGQPVNAINYERYCTLWKEYFESTDQAAPGNYLFGDFRGELQES